MFDLRMVPVTYKDPLTHIIIAVNNSPPLKQQNDLSNNLLLLTSYFSKISPIRRIKTTPKQ
ncbi:MAG: hypothetical protein SOV26_03435 [Candidatus Onthovivens sp.]|nr:hypothetical protein [Candidatus Onthovivens sp.]